MGFPTKKYHKYLNFHQDYFGEFNKAFNSIDLESINKIINIFEKNYISENQKVLICGNGGSSSLSDHFACDHQKILSSIKKLKPVIISLNSNNALFSAISNDINYESVFSEQVNQIGQKNDILLTISSSGNSQNILNAIQAAKKKCLITVSFTGFNGGRSKKLSDYNVHVKSNNYGIIESLHHTIMNLISQYIRNKNLTKKEIKKINF